MKYIATILLFLLIPSICFGAVTYTSGNKRINVSGSESPSSIYAADVAGGWGVVTNTYTNTYGFAAGIDVADGGTLTISNNNIIMSVMTTGLTDDYYFNTNSTGNIDVNNSMIYCVTFSNANDDAFAGSGTITFDYSSLTAANNYNNFSASIFNGPTVTLNNVNFNIGGVLFYNCSYAVNGRNNFYGIGTSGKDAIWRSTDDTHTTSWSETSVNLVDNFDYLIEVTSTGESTSQVMRNIYLKDTANLGYNSHATAVHYLINLVQENVLAKNLTTGRIYIGWNFSPTFVDSTGSLLNGATVTLGNCTPAGSGTTGADGKLGTSFDNIQGYYVAATGTSLQGTATETLIIDPASGETLTTTVDITESWNGGYVSVQGIDAITSPILATYNGTVGDTISVMLPSTTGATIKCWIDTDLGVNVKTAEVMTEYSTRKYTYEWNTTGRTNGENFIITVADETNGQSYYYNAQLRISVGGSGGFTSYDRGLLNGIDSKTAEITAIKAKTDLLSFSDKGVIADTQEISAGGGLTGEQAAQLASIDGATTEITAIKAKTDLLTFTDKGIVADTSEIASQTTVSNYANYKADVSALALEATVSTYNNYKADVSALALEATVSNYANYKADVTDLASIKLQTDKLLFDGVNHLYVNTAEISVTSSGLTYTQNLLLEDAASMTSEIDLLLDSVEITLNYLGGNQMIDATGKHTFYKIGSPAIQKQYQLLDSSGAATTTPSNAWGRQDVTP